MRRSTLVPLISIVVLLSVTACGSGDESKASPPAPPASVTQATATTTPASSPSATTVPAASPSATPNGSPLPSDVAAIVSLLTTATTGAQLLDHAQLTPTECREVVPPITAFPKCPPGSKPGTLIPQFRMVMCEPVEAGDVAVNLDAWAAKPRALYAVTRDNAAGSDLFTWIPLGDYGIIFTSEDGSGMLFTVAGGRIVGASAACGQPPAYLMDKLPHTAVLLGPFPAK